MGNNGRYVSPYDSIFILIIRLEKTAQQITLQKLSEEKKPMALASYLSSSQFLHPFMANHVDR